MKRFFVIWRGDEDDFFITALDFDTDFDTSKLSNQQWVQMAFDAEYPGEANPFVGFNGACYEMIDVFSGNNITFHMR